MNQSNQNIELNANNFKRQFEKRLPCSLQLQLNSSHYQRIPEEEFIIRRYDSNESQRWKLFRKLGLTRLWNSRWASSEDAYCWIYGNRNCFSKYWWCSNSSQTFNIRSSFINEDQLTSESSVVEQVIIIHNSPTLDITIKENILSTSLVSLLHEEEDEENMSSFTPSTTLQAPF